MTADNVSNEILLQDIEVTQKESDAYNEISHGFHVLATLPENQGATEGKNCLMNEQKYKDLERRCLQFLNKLIAIKKERGL
jgi:hypothetical protein